MESPVATGTPPSWKASSLTFAVPGLGAACRATVVSELSTRWYVTPETTAPPGNVNAKLKVPELALPSPASSPASPLGVPPASGFWVEPSGADSESAPVSGFPVVPSTLASAGCDGGTELSSPPPEHAAADAHNKPETATSGARLRNERFVTVEPLVSDQPGVAREHLVTRWKRERRAAVIARGGGYGVGQETRSPAPSRARQPRRFRLRCFGLGPWKA